MMHFVGMTAVALYLPTGERVPMYFDPGLTAISAIICSLVVMWAFYFASQDEHWNTIVEERLQLAQKIYAKAEAKKMRIEQKRKLAKKNTKINKRLLIEENESGSSDAQQLAQSRHANSTVGNRNRRLIVRNNINDTKAPVVETRVRVDAPPETAVIIPGKRRSKLDIQILILFDQPWRIVISGLFVAASVLAMHHLGIHSIRMQASYDFDLNIVLLSAVIALVAATAGIFIVFRVLPYYPNDIVKVIASFMIALAVNGMHFTGMAALRYSYAPDTSFSADGLIDGYQNPIPRLELDSVSWVIPSTGRQFTAENTPARYTQPFFPQSPILYPFYAKPSNLLSYQRGRSWSTVDHPECCWYGLEAGS
ncbi:hypothetical protein HDU77_001538 [Chytriomyces hyalinus]|nr:hypothetical protein HDU77_001538 [Chytriomyces hyalinus]